MSVHPDERAHAYCCAYEDRTPIMSVSHQGLRLTITPAGDRHTGQADVRFARALTAAATRYLAEVERFISAADTSEAA